ncbi:MAG TPA: OmpA family protein [Anaeromyxobacteraceae bacterium]|nr:OmpA family protein [Anaeromyxobacteraceae bacterium]
MRRAPAVVFSLAIALSLAGCPAKPKPGECKSSTDCAGQEGYGKVCVEGHCQECAADSDCKGGFACKDNRCVPRPECAADADCPAGKICQAERCVERPAAECNADADCGEGSCQGGKCVKGAKAGAVEPACADAAAFTIWFGFDQSTLTAQSQGSLQKLADCLKKAPAKRVRVAGHCDERGTTQYNLALGGRRAEAARKYLTDLGATGKIETVSYGKERPVCSDSTEDCWAKNRRDEFEVER